jgi:UTRA domain
MKTATSHGSVAPENDGSHSRLRPRALAPDEPEREHGAAGGDDGCGGHHRAGRGGTRVGRFTTGDTVSRVVGGTDIAGRLGTSGRVLTRKRRYLLDGRPVETATSYVPLEIAQGSRIAEPDSGPGGIYARLEELGHRLDHFDEEVRARMPTPDEIRALRLARGVPVFHLTRTAYDHAGRAVEVCDTIMAADAYVLSYQLPAR